MIVRISKDLDVKIKKDLLKSSILREVVLRNEVRILIFYLSERSILSSGET